MRITRALLRITSLSMSTIPNTLPLPGGIPDTHRPHTESTTTILVHKDNTAFLNPVQQYNRDLSIACIRGWNELRKEEAEARWRKKVANRKGKGKEKEQEQGGEEERPYKAQRFTILEALSATGLRSIRYAKEIPDVRYVLANDLSPSACEAMRMNVALNGVGEPVKKPVNGEGLTEEESAANGEVSQAEQMERVGRREGCTGHVKINEGDACALMYARRAPTARVDVVDLDPYGSASPFIDAAIGSIADGGLLCVTCTDLAVLAGSQYPEKALSQYGGVSVNAEYSHEVALRLVLHSLAVAAARYGRYITPLLSFSIDFYVRLFVRIDTGASKVKELASQVGTVHVCNFCQTPTEQRFGKVVEKEDKQGNVQKTFKPCVSVRAKADGCEYCGGTLHLGGPMWLGPIQDASFAQRVLKGIEGDKEKYGTWARMKGMLTVASQELDVPFYFTTNRLHGMFHASSGAVSNTISALLNAGYKVSRSHASQGSLKTDAPRQFLFDMVREYAKTSPIRIDKISENSPARVLNAGQQVHEVDFTPHPDAKRLERGGDHVFYQVNPTANWGPGTKARTVKTTTAEKRKAPAPEVKEAEVEAKRAKVEEKAEEGADEEAAMNL